MGIEYGPRLIAVGPTNTDVVSKDGMSLIYREKVGCAGLSRRVDGGFELQPEMPCALGKISEAVSRREDSVHCLVQCGTRR